MYRRAVAPPSRHRWEGNDGGLQTRVSKRPYLESRRVLRIRLFQFVILFLPGDRLQLSATDDTNHTYHSRTMQS